MRDNAAGRSAMETITGRESGFPGQLISIEKRPASRGVKALDHFFGRSALYALSADVGLFRFAVNFDTDLLKIRQPAALRKVMCMADVVSRHRLFPAYCADSTHDTPPLRVSECIM